MESNRLAQRLFRAVLLRSILVPIGLMLALAGVFVWQIGQLVRNASFVEAVDRTLAQINQLEKLHIDLETGLRGFLVTGDRRFLEPYDNASASLARLDAPIEASLADQPAASRKYVDERQRRVAWQAYAADQIRGRAANDPHALSVAASLEGKRQMDAMRSDFAGLIAEQERLRSTRSATVQRTARLVVFSACGLATLAGIAIAFVSRAQLGWLSRTYEESLARSRELAATLERRVEERTADVVRGNAQLEEANRELEAFAYSVSHDLRAPMRHITGFSQLLRMSVGPTLSVDDSENLDTIHKTAVLAGRMVDDLLAFSRVGRTQLSRRAVDMDALVKQSIVELEPELTKRGIEWTIAPLPLGVGDPSLLKMVWQNLIANAIKYTAKANTARIEIGAEIEADGVATKYFIRDNGVGFDMAYAHKLFGVFQRLHRAEDFEGTGIGLANVRRIVLRHGGDVWADGRLDGGATFSFTLPARPVEAEADR